MGFLKRENQRGNLEEQVIFSCVAKATVVLH